MSDSPLQELCDDLKKQKTAADQVIFDEIKKRFRPDDPDFQQKLFEAIGIAGQCTFVEDYRDPEDQAKCLDAIGVWIAHSIGWQGQSILDIAIAALEDSNYHTVLKDLRQIKL